MTMNIWETVSLFLLLGAATVFAADALRPLRGPATTIDGEAIQLDRYAGKVVLVVNVASRCGFTKQYAGLQALYEKYGARGLVILGFPCNQFLGQEPGTEAEIKSFCETKFGVTFPMFAKVEVKGDGAHPLFKDLTSDRMPFEDRGPVKWNFEKFLIGRDGAPLARFRSRVAPDAPELVEAIEKALNAPPPARP